ncbi:DUF945 family protein [Beggiatoa leptomitoformis]|uniref:DUF945 family protein n=1 Tax=Beggiatoa leptomitoformis TaxID=288004 RepID=A0A2N9YBX9_9GAMM|nr:DUF945 family protein [Beggiatoa leptomitoformis]ALG66755.1 DUF945 family protein [Beggiatoa leptomitoformis]AUI67904.1 DUF945 family protein [Beggiatoa leptomitoformis]
MKKLLHLSIITVLAGSVTLSLPVYADKKKTEEPAKEVAKETKSESDLQGFSVTHTVGGKAQPTAKVDSDPLALLGALKQDLIAQLAKGKPLEMTTEIKPIFSSELAKTLKGLPPITVKTNVGADGQGVSDVSVPAYKYEGTKKGEKGVIDWQGLTGQVKFPEDFSTMSQAFELAGATIDIEDTFKATLAKTTFSADLDADLYPTKLNFNLPSLEGGDKDVQFVFNKILVDFTGGKGTSGLELGKGSFSIADVNVDNKAEESQFKLNNLSVKFDTQEEKEVANYTLNFSLDKFFASQEEIDLSFLSNIELRKLDIAALLEIQKTASEMRKQQMAGKMDESMMGMAMMGSLMQALPKLMAKSPEIAMTKLNLKTEEGQLDGGFSISLDGSKPLKMDDSAAMLNALSGQADFVIDKGLIEQLMWMQMGSGEEMTEEQEKQMQTMIDQQIEDVVKQGLLVPTGEQFKLNATLKAGKLMVNGKEMPLPM